MFKISHKSQISLLIIFGFLSTANIFSQNTILWSVKHPDQNTTSYLLGTYHQMGNSFIDSLPIIKQALYTSELAVFESLGTEKDLRIAMNNRTNNTDYSKYLKTKDIEYLKEISADWAVPIPKLTPIELLTKLSQTYFKTKCGSVKPTDEWDHFDKYLIHLAQSQNMKLLGLESDSLQLNYIHEANKSAASWEDMKKPIHEWVQNIRKSKNVERNCKAVHDYMNFSLNYQLNIECGENPLINNRNDNWMKELLKILPKKNTFIAVGLLHLYGKCGLVYQLREAGYLIEPITLNN